jgi:type IV pilus assembly protein PilX
MASSLRDRETAFEVAEETLRVAEQWVDDMTFTPAGNFYSTCSGANCFNSGCDNGLCVFYDSSDPFNSSASSIAECNVKMEYPDTPPWKWVGATGQPNLWTNSAKHKTVSPTHADVAADSRYIVEFLCYTTKDSTGVECSTTDDSNCAPHFRITALAQGLTQNTRVMLQSTYKKVN